MDISFSDKVKQAVDFIKTKVTNLPSVLVILGSGLQSFVDDLKVEQNMASSEIPFFPRSSVEGHTGRVVFGAVKNINVAVLQGRTHYYEGLDMQDVTLPIHALHILGCKTLVVTNAAGGINAAFVPGDIMVINDHINFMGANPLRGIGGLNPKNPFPDMTNAYSKNLQQTAFDVAKQMDITLQQGVFLACAGPSYETKAEIRAFRQWGADAVGMSTVPEVITANYHKMQVLGFSCIANPAADLHVGGMSHSEVLKTMEVTQPKLAKLLSAVIERLGNGHAAENKG